MVKALMESNFFKYIIKELKFLTIKFINNNNNSQIIFKIKHIKIIILFNV